MVEEEINNLVKDAEFCSDKDGAFCSMFSQHRNNDGDAKECDNPAVRQQNNCLGNLDEGEIPPGCEELLGLFPSNLQPIIASSLKTYSDSALIGLEYIVEVHPDDVMNCTARAFYICVLCDKRCDIQDNIFKHIVSPAHRLSYLHKYFPRAHSLFRQADRCPENWKAEIHEYMDAIINRIESLKGRLQVLPCYRTQWEVNSQHFRTEINLRNHLRETSDIFYYDICAPFTADKMEIRANNLKSDDSNYSLLDHMLENGMGIINADKTDVPKIDNGARLEEAVILLSDDSHSETECGKLSENTVFIPTSQNLCKSVSGGTVSSKPLQETLWTLNPISQTVSQNHKKKKTTEQSIFHSVSDDDIIIEKEIFGKDIVQKPNNHQQPELWSTLGSRSPKPGRCNSRSRSTASKSRSPKPRRCNSRSRNTASKSRSPKPRRCNSRSRNTASKSRSRSPKSGRCNSRSRNIASKSRSRSPKRLRSRFSYKDRNTASKSRSPSPKHLRSKFSSSKHQPPKHRKQKRQQNLSPMNDFRNSTGFEQLEKQRGEKRGLVSPMRIKPRDNIRNEWKKFEKKFNSFKENLRYRYQIYQEKPEDHPLYAKEWTAFWNRRCAELVKEGKDPVKYDMKREWFEFWFSRMKKLKKAEIKTKKIELKKKYDLIDCEPHQDNCAVEKEHTSKESLQNREPVRFGWKNLFKKAEETLNPAQHLEAVLNQTKNLPHAEDSPLPTKLSTVVVSSPNAYSFEELRAAQNLKPICHVGNFSEIPKDTRSLSSDPHLLQVLRMLVALEDSLGSLGPSITNLLTRALSAERCKIGSSSKLLKDDTTCVDLLDTSKEKLKGLLLAGILDGVKGTAASQAVDYVTRLLKQSSNTSDSSTSVNAPAVGINMASLFNNLQAAGMLNPPQSTPMLSSAIRSDIVAEVKDKDSTLRTINLYGSDFKTLDRFTGEELKTLIVNFRTLTDSQKRDLVEYLHKLEETFAEKDSANRSEVVSPSLPPSTLLSLSSSPLSLKYRQYQSCKVINPVAPAPSSKTVYPTILKMTGLSRVDLKNHGIPLDELDSSRTSMQEGQCNGSFYYQQLDPRRNRMHQRNDGTSPSNSLYSFQNWQDPIIIPTSPVLQRISQEKNIPELFSDPWQLNNAPKTSSPLRRNGSHYW